MTSFKYYVGASIDGFIADSTGDVSWLEAFNHEAGVRQSYEEFFAGVGALVFGGETYLWLVKKLASDGEPWPYGDKPVWVFTHHELPSTEGADLTFVRGDVALWARDIAQSAGTKDVWIVGGAQLAGKFLESAVLDELHLVTVPVVLGDGINLFTSGNRSRFEFINRIDRDGQVSEVRYRLAR
ncbi:dihydrofolate reductase family protein [Glutamicibacter sp. MNS18]|uniref:dihydrofolate reductase family protein n=1 Tax=Glutamicibacter sp. MNS18 TaxID=2989817 RepID=UPI0022369932|nr:dihydrofolate reductase family protein [Glutamicibacter sp. MNS18]MCW4464541.1 dihydrofolate reductase family protein [Glutamicibacter sp. MNS18]